MPRHTVLTYINEDFLGRGPQHRTSAEAVMNRHNNGIEPGDYIRPGPILSIWGPTDDAVLSRAWGIGNRMEADDNGYQWPDNLRSMSVGDVVIVGETAYTIKGIGWRIMSSEELDHALCEQCPQCDRHAHLRSVDVLSQDEVVEALEQELGEPKAECALMGGKTCTHEVDEEPYTSLGMEELP